MSQQQKFPSGGWLNLDANWKMQQIEFALQPSMIIEEIRKIAVKNAITMLKEVDRQILNTNKKEV